MNLFRLTLPAAALIAMASTAHAATVAENLTVTISGSNTTDSIGLFGPAGANLSGQTASIHVQYISDYLPTSKSCRFDPATCTAHYNQQGANLAGSVLVSVTMNGHTVNYSPVYIGWVLLKNTNGMDMLKICSDATDYSEGLRGACVATQYTSSLTFGAPLSPTNPPLLHTSTAEDYLNFYSPSGSELPDETLSFYVTQASQ